MSDEWGTPVHKASFAAGFGFGTVFTWIIFNIIEWMFS